MELKNILWILLLSVLVQFLFLTLGTAIYARLRRITGLLFIPAAAALTYLTYILLMHRVPRYVFKWMQEPSGASGIGTGLMILLFTVLPAVVLFGVAAAVEINHRMPAGRSFRALSAVGFGSGLAAGLFFLVLCLTADWNLRTNFGHKPLAAVISLFFLPFAGFLSTCMFRHASAVRPRNPAGGGVLLFGYGFLAAFLAVVTWILIYILWEVFTFRLSW